MQNTLPTDPIATALLTTLDALTAQIDARIRADFAKMVKMYPLEDGCGFTFNTRYCGYASELMQFADGYRRSADCCDIVYSATIDGEKVAKAAADEAAATLLAWHTKLVGKLGAVDSCTLRWNNGADINMTVTIGSRTVVLVQQVVWKTAPRTRRWFAQFPARMYLDGKFTPEAALKAAIAG